MDYTYPPSSRLVLTRRNCPLADAGVVHSGVPHVRQNALVLGEPLDVSVRVKVEMRSDPEIVSTDWLANLAI